MSLPQRNFAVRRAREWLEASLGNRYVNDLAIFESARGFGGAAIQARISLIFRDFFEPLRKAFFARKRSLTLT